jgi:hypothetical protein
MSGAQICARRDQVEHRNIAALERLLLAAQRAG